VAIHPMARVALNIVHGTHAAAQARASAMDTALADAAAAMLERWPDTAPDASRTASAVQIIDSALTELSLPSAGWLIPIEPLLRAHTAPAAWAHVFARLRARAA